MDSDADGHAAPVLTPGGRDPGDRIRPADSWEYTAAQARSAGQPEEPAGSGAGSVPAAQQTGPAGAGLPTAPVQAGSEQPGAVNGAAVSAADPALAVLTAGEGAGTLRDQAVGPLPAGGSPGAAGFAAAVCAVLVAFAAVMLLSAGPAAAPGATHGVQARPAASVSGRTPVMLAAQ